MRPAMDGWAPTSAPCSEALFWLFPFRLLTRKRLLIISPNEYLEIAFINCQLTNWTSLSLLSYICTSCFPLLENVCLAFEARQPMSGVMDSSFKHSVSYHTSDIFHAEAFIFCYLMNCLDSVMADMVPQAQQRLFCTVLAVLSPCPLQISLTNVGTAQLRQEANKASSAGVSGHN